MLYSFIRIIFCISLFSPLLSREALAVEAPDKNGFMINSSNYQKYAIETLIAKQSNNSTSSVDWCALKWRLVWGEIEKRNLWAMIAYISDHQSPAQNSGVFKGSDPKLVRYINIKNIVSSIYYAENMENYIKKFEGQFTNLRGKSNARLRIAELYFEAAEREGFIAFANCAAASKDARVSRKCFAKWSRDSGVVDFSEYVELVDGSGISRSSDLNCN